MLIDDKVSTRYKDRQDTYMNLVTDIEKLVKGKEEIILCFFHLMHIWERYTKLLLIEMKI